MSRTRRAQFLLIAAISLVLLVIIIASPSVGGLGRNRQSRSRYADLQSGDILIHDRERIWWLNPSDFSLELLVDVTQDGLLIGGDVRVSPQHDYIYMTAEDVEEDHEGLRLIRYRLSDGSIQTVAEIPGTPGLARMSPISPDGKRTILFMAAGLDRSTIHLAYYCVLEIETEECIPLDRGVDINETIWLREDVLITAFYDSIDVLSFDDGHLLTSKSIGRSDLTFSAAGFVPDCCLTLAASRLGEDDLEPVLLSLDLDSFELSELPIAPTDYDAAFNSVSTAPNRRYISYQRAHRLEVQNLETGEVVVVLDGVMYSSWMPDSEKIVAYTNPAPFFYHLVMLDIPTGQIQKIYSPDHQIYIVTTP